MRIFIQNLKELKVQLNYNVLYNIQFNFSKYSLWYKSKIITNTDHIDEALDNVNLVDNSKFFRWGKTDIKLLSQKEIKNLILTIQN